MAFRWRIRHKLMLGLGLVVGLIGLLLGGTLYGLVSFRENLRSIDSKYSEIMQAERCKAACDDLKGLLKAGKPDEFAKIDEGMGKVRAALKDYKTALEDTLSHGRDPDLGVAETEFANGIGESLDRLKRALDKERQEAVAGPLEGSRTLWELPQVQSEMDILIHTAGDLWYRINNDVINRSKDSKLTYKRSLWIISTTSLFGVLFLFSLLRIFYAWVFFPIRDLEKGAGRIAQGDFEHRIEVHTSDEMADLAAAFNHMTDQLREMYGDLASQVNDKSRQLIRSERLAGVGFLAAGVAHEINNPLASIAFCSEALEARLNQLLGRFPNESEVIRKYLKMIQEEAFRCKAITQRLLEFSRGGERQREPTDLVDVVQAVLDMVQHLQNGKGKQVVFQPDQRVIAWVNGQEIKSVVLNLVVNALDSMDEGGTLTIRLAQRNFMAVLDFQDTGCGMTAEVLENIFEPFFTRSRTGKGTGLGLSISHRVISQHGGEIEAFSPGPNRGSTFVVRLPLQPVANWKEETLEHAAA